MPQTIAVSQEIVDWIMMPVRGKGGFQDFLRKLQGQLDAANLTLSLDSTDPAKISQYLGYEPGGFEGRLKPLFDVLKAQGLVASEEETTQE